MYSVTHDTITLNHFSPRLLFTLFLLLAPSLASPLVFLPGRSYPFTFMLHVFLRPACPRPLSFIVGCHPRLLPICAWGRYGCVKTGYHSKGMSQISSASAGIASPTHGRSPLAVLDTAWERSSRGEEREPNTCSLSPPPPPPHPAAQTASTQDSPDSCTEKKRKNKRNVKNTSHQKGGSGHCETTRGGRA